MREPVEVVRAFTGALRAGDVTSCLALLSEDNVFAEPSSLPYGGDYVGRDGFMQALRDVQRDFEITLDVPQMDRCGERQVLVQMGGTMTARSTGRSMPLQALDLYTVTDGLVSRVEVFYKDTHAVVALLRADANQDG
jgi:ketosteroid isomerase-like protein